MNRQSTKTRDTFDSLGSPSFIGLLVTQWLTAINDNVFRWLVVGIAKDYFPGQPSMVLTYGLVVFVAPYLVLAAPAGWLADRFSKRNVIVWCKVLEIVVMILGVIAILVEDPVFLFAVVGLMGAQSALFAPSKLGQIPESLAPNKIPMANGFFGLASLTATIIGMWIGGALADYSRPMGRSHLEVTGSIIIGIAVIGTIASLFIRTIPAANPTRPFPYNALQQTIGDLLTLMRNKALFLVSLGVMFFWSLGALFQLVVDRYAEESGTFLESERTPLLVAVVLGVGIGNVAAGVISRGRIELGMLPIGLAGIVLFSFAISFVDTAIFNTGVTLNTPYILSILLFFMIGFSAGLFDVPVASYMQQRSPSETRGAILSANNFLTFSGMILVGAIFQVMTAPTQIGSFLSVPNTLIGEHAPLRVEELKILVDQDIKKLKAELDVAPKGIDVGSGLNPRDPNSWPKPLALVEKVEPKERNWILAKYLWDVLDLAKERKLTLNSFSYYEKYAELEQRKVIKAVFEQHRGPPRMTARHIFVAIALFCTGLGFVVLWLLPQATARFIISFIALRIARIEVRDFSNVSEGRAALLVCNQCSGLGKLLLQIVTGRRIVEVLWEEPRKKDWEYKWSRFWGLLPICGGPSNIQTGLAEARRKILDAGAIVVFPKIKPGEEPVYPAHTMKIVEGINAPYVPVLIEDGLPPSKTGPIQWISGLFASRKKPILIVLGEPQKLFNPTSESLRRQVQSLGAMPMSNPTDQFVPPAWQFLRSCKLRKSDWKLADSTGAKLTGNELLMRTMILRRLLNRHVLKADEKYVALLLPPSVPAVIANMVMGLDQRIAVNLNYTVSAEIMNKCIELCGIKHVLTSRKVMEKLDIKLNAEVFYLEDLKDKVTLSDKIAGAWASYVSSADGIARSLSLQNVQPDDVLTVIFTSGSTGVPKGVMLTNNNIATNVAAIQDKVKLNRNDTIVGILPFFHSFGYTVTLWGAMDLDIRAAYHFSPLDAKQVGKITKEHGGTVLLTTPTFLRSFLRRCTPEEFKSLQIVVAGAEKLPTELCDAFEEKFGVRPVEGYGTTELSPLVSVNVPPTRAPKDGRITAKEGTVGQPIQNVLARVTDVDTGAVLGKNQAGMLWISGPNVMKGYLHREDLTKEAVVDGWYKTGDVAEIDDDGFIRITGRMSRFSKIGGEMVPHIQVEEALNSIIGASEEEGLKAVVTSVPDEKKGERLIVVHTKLNKSIEELRQGLLGMGLPPIYVPGADSFLEIETIPVLGTGKLDLKGLKDVAMQRFGDK